MRRLDETEQLAFDGDPAMAVMGARGEFMLVPLDRGIEGAQAAAIERGFHYCGILALVDGRPAAKCEGDLDSMNCMMRAALEFAARVADRMKPPKREDDFAAFAAGLFRLEDPRDSRG